MFFRLGSIARSYGGRKKMNEICTKIVKIKLINTFKNTKIIIIYFRSAKIFPKDSPKKN